MIARCISGLSKRLDPFLEPNYILERSQSKWPSSIYHYRVDYKKYEREIKNNPLEIQFGQLIDWLSYEAVCNMTTEEFYREYARMKVINDMRNKQIKKKNKGVK